MSDLRIEDATPDTDITGTEKLPVSDGGVAKCVTADDIKAFVFAKIAQLVNAGAVDVSANAVYIKKDGALVPVGADTFATAVLNYGFGKAGASSIDGNETFAIKNGNTLQSVTLGALKTWLQGALAHSQIAALDAASALADENLAMVSQSGTDKKTTLAVLKAYCLAGLFAYATESTAAVGADDYLFIYTGGTVKKVKRSSAGFADGDVTAPATQTNGAVPVWDTTAKKLTGGYAITDEVAETPGGTTRIPSETAVRTALDAVAGDVKAPSSTTTGRVPKWNATAKKLDDGYDVATAIGTSASNSQLPTAKAVKDAVDAAGDVKSSGFKTAGDVLAWDSDGKAKGSYGVTDEIDPATASDETLPTSKAVSDVIPANLSTDITALKARPTSVNITGTVVPYGGNLTATGYPFGTLASVQMHPTADTTAVGVYFNTGDAQNPAWKLLS